MVADGPARSSLAPHRTSGTDRLLPVLNTERLTPPHPALLGAAPPVFRQDLKRPRKRSHHPSGPSFSRMAGLGQPQSWDKSGPEFRFTREVCPCADLLRLGDAPPQEPGSHQTCGAGHRQGKRGSKGEGCPRAQIHWYLHKSRNARFRSISPSPPDAGRAGERRRVLLGSPSLQLSPHSFLVGRERTCVDTNGSNPWVQPAFQPQIHYRLGVTPGKPQ